ncbi:unnamed protein product [Dracunculus medinensis]|uniref:DUF1758 domain-containing protein n=1 Tax=Dracunculus medinensis TaxID=318479 RepID=A0A0N4UD91_DRAME|nr:unnamed protein product [Dracunculus medinensis]
MAQYVSNGIREWKALINALNTNTHANIEEYKLMAIGHSKNGEDRRGVTETSTNNKAAEITIDEIRWIKKELISHILEGEAKELVEGFSMDGESYRNVWKILESRYGDKSIIIKELYKELRELNPKTKDIKDIRKDLKRIFRQLTSPASESYSRVKCMNCSKDQNTVLCQEKREERQQKIQQDQEQMIVTTANFLRENSIVNEVFFPCMEIFVINPLKPNKKIRALILLDTGSQQSYISETLREKLQLVAREQQTIPVSSFASKIPQKYHTSIEVGIILHDGSIFKIMASTMTQLTLQIKYMQLEGYQSSRTEVLGSRTDPTDLMDDEESYEQFEKSIKRNEEGRYAISWPWKSTDPKIESNFGLAFETPCFKYYIPHLPVISPDKQSTKLRIVFDASAVIRKGYSLKNQLYKGPTPIPHLAGIILRLRLGKFILMADIEKAFL